MAFLLDTNAWIHFLKEVSSPIRAKLTGVSPSEIVLCSVVKAELLHGAEKYGNRERRFQLLQELFDPYRSIPFDDAAAAEYGPLRHALECAGRIIGPYDLEIAAICLANQLTLVTSNVAEFSRVPGLTIEDWLKT